MTLHDLLIMIGIGLLVGVVVAPVYLLRVCITRSLLFGKPMPTPGEFMDELTVGWILGFVVLIVMAAIAYYVLFIY
jgi:hypothetical protein